MSKLCLNVEDIFYSIHPSTQQIIWWKYVEHNIILCDCEVVPLLKIMRRDGANLVISGGTVGCHINNGWCCQW